MLLLALTATIRRTPAACIAATMARVPCAAMPASAFGEGQGRRAGVGSGDRGLERRRVGGRRVAGRVGGDGAHRPGQLARVAYHGGDVVTGGDGLLQKFPADAAGGRDDRESHVSLHYLTSERLV